MERGLALHEKNFEATVFTEAFFWKLGQWFQRKTKKNTADNNEDGPILDKFWSFLEELTGAKVI